MANVLPKPAHEDQPDRAPRATPTLSPLVQRALQRELAQRRQLRPHAQLGIPLDAAPDQIEAAFRRLERQYDPQSYAAYGAAAVACAVEISDLLRHAFERMREPSAAPIEVEPALPSLAPPRRDETHRALETLRGAIARRLAEAEQHRSAGRTNDAIRVFESVLVLDRSTAVARAELEELRRPAPERPTGRLRAFLRRAFG